MRRRRSPPSSTTLAVFLSWAALLGAQACGWIALLPSFQGPRCRGAWGASAAPPRAPQASMAPPASSSSCAAAATAASNPVSVVAAAADHLLRHPRGAHLQPPPSSSSSSGQSRGGLRLLGSSSPSLLLQHRGPAAAAATSSGLLLAMASSPTARVGSLLQGTCGGAARGMARPAHPHQQQQQELASPSAYPRPQHSSTALHAAAVPPPPSNKNNSNHNHNQEPRPGEEEQVEEGAGGPSAGEQHQLLQAPPPPPSSPGLVGRVLSSPLTLTLLAAGGAYLVLQAVSSTGPGLGSKGPEALVAGLVRSWQQRAASSPSSSPPAPGAPMTGLDLYWRIFLAGGVCASVSHGWAVPLDVVKTRLQTDPDKYDRGIWHTFHTIRAEEGPGMLLKGMGATLIGYSIQGSLKYGLYAMFKASLAAALPQASIFVVWVLASIAADVFASTALCPLEATRIRLVADPSFAKGTVDGLMRMVTSEGAASIFRGMPAILAKQLPYTIVQLCGFELLTRLAYSWEATAALLIHPSPWQWLVSFASAMITGIFASLASQPGDAILSRVNKERGDGPGAKPVLRAMADTVQELGLRGLYRGTKARLLHVGLIVTVQLVIYDLVKQMVGLPATGAH